MRRRLQITFFLLASAVAMWSVPADEYWQVFYQPDGTSVELCLVGDEYERHYEDRDGNVYEIGNDGWWHQLSRSESERKILSRRNASPLMRCPKGAEAINLAPRGLVILVNYSDVNFESSNDLAGMTEMLNGDNYTYEDATGSARRYFIDQSDGQYTPQFDVIGPVTLDQPRSYYGANNGSKLDVNAAQMVVDACLKADAAGADFTLYDNNHDGTVDFVFVIFADKGEADGGPAESIWPHNWYVYRGAKKTCIIDGLQIDNYACAAEKNGRTGKRAGIGTFCHEFGHVIGLPDYYDTRSGINYSNRLTPRYWSIMDVGSYLNESKTPPNYSSFDKYYIGWHTPTNLGTQEQRITLVPTGEEGYKTYQVTTSGKLVAARTAETVYYIESRERVGWDRYLPGHGMVIWQVKYNSSAWNGNAPNNTAYSPLYTLLSATGSTTDLGTSSDSYPGKMGVTYKQIAQNRTVSDITEENQLVSFVYNRTARTVILTAGSVLALDDQTAATTPYYSVSGSFKDVNGTTYKARIQVLSSTYAGNYTSTNFSLPDSYIEQDGVRLNPTGISGKVTINGQNLYHIDLSLTMDEFTSYRLVGDYKVNVTEPVQHQLQVNCSEGGSVTLLAVNYTSKTNIGTYSEGTSVQLLPSPDKGWQFSEWSGKDASLITNTGNLYRLTMAQNDLTVNAAFVRSSCEVGNSVSPANKGTVTMRLNGEVLSNGTIVPYMSQVTYEASASDNYRFNGWSDGNMTNPRVVSVTSDTLLTALFTYIMPQAEDHTITIALSPYGKVRLSSVNKKDNFNSGTYQEGTMVALTPVPSTGYQFAGWTGTDADKVKLENGVHTLIIGRQDYTLEALWEKRTFSVSISSSPIVSGNVTVAVDGNALKEGEQIPYQTKASVTANPIQGWTFTRWSDNVTTNPREIEITEDLNLTAYFSRRNYTLVTAVSPEGKAQIEATANGGIAADMNAIPYETNMLLSVIPVQGWQFDKWNDGGADNPRTYTVKSDAALTAEVIRRMFTVSSAATPAGNGTVKMTAESKTIDNGTTLPYETEIKFEAIPAKSYRFDGWSDGVTSNPRTVILTDNLTLTAMFTYVVPIPENHTVTIAPSSYGQVTLRSVGKEDRSNTGTYQEGTTVVLIPQPITGYELAGWSGKDASYVKNNDGVYSISIGKQDYTLEAVWKKQSFIVNIANTPDKKGGITLRVDGQTVENGTSVEYDKTVTLQANPEQGWTFSHWSDNLTTNPRDIQVKDNINLTAHFVRQNYSLSVTVDPEGKADVAIAAQEGGTYDHKAIPYETTMTLTVTPIEGWQFVQWNDNNKMNPRAFNITGDISLTAQLTRMTYVVTSSVTPANKGKVRITVDGNDTPDGSMLPYESQAVFEAVPDYGWRFAGWSDGETANPRTTTVTSAIGITAIMVREQYTVETATLPAGKAEIELTANKTEILNGQKADFETDIEALVIPVEGWRFDKWSDGETANPRTIDLTQDTLLKAQLSRRQYTLQISATPNDKGNVIGTSNGQQIDDEALFDYETAVQLYASPSPNCHFVCWNDSVTDNPRNITVTKDLALQAIFAKDDIEYLSIKENSDSLYYDQMADYEDAKIKLVVIERTIKANTYSTFCLPFDVPDITGTDLCGSVFQFVSATGDADKGMSLNFTFATEIKAGVPYLLLTTDVIVNPFFKNVVMRRLEGKTLKGGTVEFRAVMRPVRLMNMGKSVVAFRDNKVYYPNATAGMLLYAFRAYFYLPGNATAPIRQINILSSEEPVREDTSSQSPD
ncbi:MAG: M6 family metalloprotease domain-containing protein [Paludibacteraceae bacterium]|nr:M6 family metalloprotease domain-containing protein [Paludibacteraceae bacterium]